MSDELVIEHAPERAAAKTVDWVEIRLPDVNGMKRSRSMPRDQAISILRNSAALMDTVAGLDENGQPMTVHQPAYSADDIAAMLSQADRLEADAR
jgi:hypothetical protein